MARFALNLPFLHIKRRTEGTSNELSFSVLDAKSNDAPQPERGPHTVSELGKVAVFTLPGKQQVGDVGASTLDFGVAGRHRGAARHIVEGAASLGPAQEVARRKQKRRAGRLLGLAGALAALGVVAIVGGNLYQSFIDRQHGGEISLAAGVALLEQSDEAVLALDEAVAAPASDDQAHIDALVADASAAALLLDRASNYAEEAVAQDDEERIREGASMVKEAAAARKALLEQGKLILVQNLAAKKATGYAEQAWETALSADEESRRAAGLAAGETADGAAQATEASERALSLFQDAIALLRQAKSAYPEANFSLLEAYLEKRATAQQNAVVSDTAQLHSNDVGEAANAAAYNEAETDAAVIAAQLPENPAQPIVDAYERIGGEADAAYRQARTRAARADASVRELAENQG